MIPKKIKLIVRKLPPVYFLLSLLRRLFCAFRPGGEYWKYEFNSLVISFFLKKIQLFISNKGYNLEILRNNKFIIILDNGIRFYWNPFDHTDLIGMPLRGDYEPECVIIAKELIKEGDIVFDIGANFGWYSCHFSKFVGGSGRVHIFEPTDIMIRLEENIQLNRFQDIGILNNIALSDKDCDESLFVPHKLGTPFASLRQHTSYRLPHEKINVPAIKIDTYVKAKEITKINFMKIDIEGAELPVLKGATHTLSSFSPIIMFELQEAHTKYFNYLPIDLMQFLNKFGYLIFEIRFLNELILKKVTDFNDVSSYNFVACKNPDILLKAFKKDE
ncbi:MAG: FkbM family methyltransferase [Candidatus Omnitrophica bacterium]|nr:FkbM family methyltransferase [Candidatus Omnitrophota bacterium]MBU1924750.1 FkbM family methyltransferase [Candidatus Omnitrophota bacterium]